MKICLWCQSQYIGHGKMFCSVACKMAHRNAPERNPALPMASRLKRSIKRKGKNYCNGRVMSERTRKKISDALLGRVVPREVVEKIRATLKEKYKNGVPEYILEAWSKSNKLRSGPNHPNWKGGITPQRTKERRTEEYKNFVKTALKRDNYTCQKCGVRCGLGYNPQLEVHHIKPYAEYTALRFEPSNGVTLCRKCHDETKKGFSRPVRLDSPLPVPKTCVHCGKQFQVKNPRKFCPDCKKIICCPVCGSSVCHHSARKNLSNTNFS